MHLDVLPTPPLAKDHYRDIGNGISQNQSYAVFPVANHKKLAERYSPLRVFMIPDKGSDKSKRLIRKYQDAKFLHKATPMLMENNQIAALYLGEGISATVVFQNDQWVNIAMHKRGEKKAMLTAKAHFSQSKNPAKLLDKLLGLFDDGR